MTNNRNGDDYSVVGCHIEPHTVPAWLWWFLTIFSYSISLVFIGTALFFATRRLPHDISGAIAALSIGVALLIAGQFAFLHATYLNRRKYVFDSSESLRSSSLLRVCAFTFSIPASLCAFGFLSDGLVLFNQEYLHWFTVQGHLEFDDADIHQEMLLKLILGEAFMLLVFFLWWFALIKGQNRSHTMTYFLQTKEDSRDSSTKN